MTPPLGSQTSFDVFTFPLDEIFRIYVSTPTGLCRISVSTPTGLCLRLQRRVASRETYTNGTLGINMS